MTSSPNSFRRQPDGSWSTTKSVSVDYLLDGVEHDLTGYVIFDQDYIRYLTNFSFLATERPVAFAENASHGTVRCSSLRCL